MFGVAPRIEAITRIMDENSHVTAVDIALWQEAFNKDIDEYPSVGELIEFAANMRAEESFCQYPMKIMISCYMLWALEWLR